jgi:hypothetical protein
VAGGGGGADFKEGVLGGGAEFNAGRLRETEI